MTTSTLLQGLADLEQGATLSQRASEAADFVPGASLRPDADVTGSSEDELDELAEELAELAREEASALGRGRAWLVSSELWASAGRLDAAKQAAEEAATSAPKLSLAALAWRQLHGDTAPTETREQLLESSARLAGDAATRTHASLLLAESLRTRGENERASALLDHASRNSEGDMRIALERVLARLTSGQSSAGLDMTVDLRAAAARVSEIFGGRPSETTTPGLSLVRAERALARGDVVDVARHLLATPRAPLQQLGATLLATRPESASALDTRVSNGVTDGASVASRVARALAERDTAAARALLEAAVPDALEPLERALLEALCQLPSSVESDGRDSSSASLDASPLLRRVLGLRVVADAASTFTSLRLGSLLADRSRKADARDLAEQLATRGREVALASSLSFDTHLDAGDFAAAARVLLADRNFPLSDARRSLLAAWLFEAAGDAESATELYASLEADSDLSLAAERGIERVTTNDGATARAPVDFRVDAEAPRLEEADLRRALLSPDDAPRQLLDLAERWQEPFLLLAAFFRADRLARSDVRDEASERLEQLDDPVLAASAALRSLVDRANGSSATSDGSEDETLVAFRARHATASEHLPWLGSHLFGIGQRNEGTETTHSNWLLAERIAHDLQRERFSEAFADLNALRARAPTEFVAATERQLGELLLDTTRLSEEWLTAAKSEDPRSRRRAYEKLFDLDRRRGNASGALLWLRTQIEDFPEDPSALLHLEDELLAARRTDEWEQVRERLAKSLPEPERRAYSIWNGALALARSDLRAARRHLEPLLDGDAPDLLALRVLSNSALEKRDDEAFLRHGESLFALVSTDLDRVATALGLAFAEARLGHVERARHWIRVAAETRADLFPVGLAAAQLAPINAEEEVLDTLEHLAGISAAAPHRAHFWLDAARLRHERGDVELAIEHYRRVLESEPESASAFNELSEILLERAELEPLADLLEFRIERTSDRAEIFELSLRLADVLIDTAQPEAARRHVERALEITPEDSRALRAHAGLCLDLDDFRAAEGSLVRLRALLPEGAERRAVLRSLGDLYQERLGSLEKAMDAYEAILAETPDDHVVARRLVAVFSDLGLAERATALQTRLIQSVTSEDEKRRGALVLADLYERIGKDSVRAAATLERTRKAWPLDAEVLAALAGFMERQGDAGGRRLLVDRVAKDALRALENRLDTGLFDTLVQAADLSEHTSLRDSVQAARTTFLGEPSHFPGGQLKALDPDLDDLLAPAGLPLPLRTLLRKTGAAMDLAFSIDLSALRAQKLTSGPVVERLTQISSGLGGQAPEVFVAESLGSRCLPFTMHPLRFVVGPRLDELAPDARDYLMLRAFKLQLLGAGALARSRPEDSWSMLAALLLLFSPTWRPRGVDARKVAQSRALVEQGLARVGYDDDVPVLALETIGALGEQGENLGNVVRALASRAALLAVGSPNAAVLATAAGGDKPIPASGPPRFRWFESHPEAKELLLFSVSDEHARAREQLGLAPVRAGRAPAPPRAPSLGPRPPMPSAPENPSAPPRRPPPRKP